MLKRRITRITIKNYRSITDLTVEMPDLMVLVGENGSGKSNFVDALRFLSDAVRNGIAIAISKRGGITSILSKNRKNMQIGIEIELSIDNDNYVYGFVLDGKTPDAYRTTKEYFQKNGQDILNEGDLGWNNLPQNNTPTLTLTLPLLIDNAQIRPIYQFLQEFSFFTITPDNIRDPQMPANAMSLDENGNNFASILNEIYRHHKNYRTSINEYLDVILDIKEFQIRQIGNRYVVNLHHSSQIFELSQESDGTIRILAMLTALHQPHTPSLLMIEEPELFIHPRALAYICSAIDLGSLRQQIIITTHSLDLIQMFDERNPNVLRIVEKTDDGTQIGILDPYQRDIINEQIFKTSDLIRVEGLRRAEHE
jgi:predicted ATPase